MKLWAAAMVRNEADIVELFVRHNLALLDGLVVVDHGSSDQTLAILTALQQERLPLHLLRSDDNRFLQAEIITDLTRRIFASTGADFVFPLDGDEFIRAPSRRELERALASIPGHAHGQLHWQTYVPAFDGTGANVVDVIRGARRAEREIHALKKLVVARHFQQAPRAIITQGLHDVAPYPRAPIGELLPAARLRADAVALAHVPVRSADQFASKIAVKKLARLAASHDWTAESSMQTAYRALRRDGTVSREWLALAASNWCVPENDWQDPASRRWIADPFLADVPVRHTPPPARTPVPRVVDAIARMVGTRASPSHPGNGTRAATP